MKRMKGNSVYEPGVNWGRLHQLRVLHRQKLYKPTNHEAHEELEGESCFRAQAWGGVIFMDFMSFMVSAVAS